MIYTVSNCQVTVEKLYVKINDIIVAMWVWLTQLYFQQVST